MALETVRAKFVVQERTEFNESGGNGWKIRLTAVYDDNPDSENGKFFKYTPNGEINLSIMTEEAARLFEVGAEYYIDFSKASVE